MSARVAVGDIVELVPANGYYLISKEQEVTGVGENNATYSLNVYILVRAGVMAEDRLTPINMSGQFIRDELVLPIAYVQQNAEINVNCNALKMMMV